MISERLKELREKAGLTQLEFSKEIGVAVSTYNAYEQGTSFPKSDVLVRVCNIYNVSADWLLGLNDRNLFSSVTKDYAFYARCYIELVDAFMSKETFYSVESDQGWVGNEQGFMETDDPNKAHSIKLEILDPVLSRFALDHYHLLDLYQELAISHDLYLSTITQAITNLENEFVTIDKPEGKDHYLSFYIGSDPYLKS